ncbi:hypothetical protein [Ekhidna sp.]|uniref:hypothetical protein n=1 Tax=Ekhidna sp. TaxID=2608089 RepID=UPI0032984B46
MEGKLNGKLNVEDIRYPDVDFTCLETLGKPIKVEESHSGAGDDYTFYYKGMTIYFSNVSTEELTLALIEFNDIGKSFLELKNKNRISVSGKINKQFSDSNMNSLDIPNSGDLTIKFHDNEGASLIFIRNEENIEKIKIYF